jgi:uncharacterized damage-inducible protein DinB
MSITEIGFGDLPMELATTRKTIECVPDDKLDWRPHEKSFSMGELAAHMANLTEWGVTILTTDDLDLSQPFPDQDPPTSTAQILATFDEKTAAWVRAMDEADDETMMGIWTLRMGDQVLTAFPRTANLRSFVVSHLIHHRAQLGVYLRLLDLPVPSTYGPSADENPFA